MTSWVSSVWSGEKLLQKTLEEEAESDRQLTELAESSINPDAAEAEPEVTEEATTEAKSEDQTAR